MTLSGREGISNFHANIKENEAMSVANRMEEKLRKVFSPCEVEVLDQSAMHAGHAGSRPEGETHFHVKIAAAAFAGKSRVMCHRMVNEALAEELAGPVHALAITTRVLEGEG